MTDTVDFDCPHCGTRYSVTPDYLESFGGQETTCSACQRTLTIPPASLLSPAAEATPALSYEAPQVLLTRGSGVWRKGNVLVMARGGKLPRRCPKCNGNVVCFRRLDLTASGGQFRGPVSLLVRLATDETAAIKVGLCARHNRSWKIRTYSGPLALAGAALLFTAGLIAGNQRHGEELSHLLEGIASATAVAAVFWMMLKPALLKPIRIDKQHLYLTGVSEDYLAALPDLAIAGEVVNRDVAGRLQG